LVVVGEAGMLSAFRSVTVHGTAILGYVDGDHTASSARDLGQIVWPVVREALSGFLGRALRDLAASAGSGRATFGLEAVAALARKGVRGTLLVEDDFHQRGSLRRGNLTPVISPDVDVRDVMDDVVDAVIEKVLESGGDAVFTPGGSMKDRGRIVLLLRGEEGL
jgi:Bacterial archaeo-eukaryotic release factor family 3